MKVAPVARLRIRINLGNAERAVQNSNVLNSLQTLKEHFVHRHGSFSFIVIALDLFPFLSLTLSVAKQRQKMKCEMPTTTTKVSRPFCATFRDGKVEEV